jgi:hypothetical protein
MTMMMSHMQATMDAMRMDVYNMTHKLEEQKALSEKREEWLEQRINQLERRSEKVERSTERLHNTMQTWDLDEMAQNQRKLLHLAQTGTSQAPTQRGLTVRSDTSPTSSPRPNSGNQPASPAKGGLPSPAPAQDAGPQLSKKLDQQLQSITAQLEQLVSYAEDATESRKLLWRIELGVRQLRAQGTAGLRESASPSHGQPPSAPATAAPRENRMFQNSQNRPGAGSKIFSAAAGGMAQQGAPLHTTTGNAIEGSSRLGTAATGTSGSGGSGTSGSKAESGDIGARTADRST